MTKIRKNEKNIQKIIDTEHMCDRIYLALRNAER